MEPKLEALDSLDGEDWRADFCGENFYYSLCYELGIIVDLTMGIEDWLAFLLRFLKMSFIFRISILLACTCPFN